MDQLPSLCAGSIIRQSSNLVFKATWTTALLITLSASTWAAATNLIIPVNQTITVAQSGGCLTEDVVLTGNLKILFVDTLLPDGDRATIVTNWQGVKGTGLATGTTYQGTSVTQTTVFFTGEPPFSTTLASSFNIIGRGEANNLLVHENGKVTVNGNGEVTATFDKLSVTCH